MPITSAAAKAFRQNIKARARNAAVKNAIKKMAVQFRKAVTAKQSDKAKTTAGQLIRALDKAAQKKIISRNLAARRKSRLHRALRKVGAV